MLIQRHIEIPERSKQVDGNQTVHHITARDLRNVPIFALGVNQVVVQDIVEGSERDHDYEVHHHELHGVDDCLNDQLHVVAIRWEEAHPVEYFHPHEEAEEGTDVPH